MKKTALVLAGGGSRGAFQIGVWKALIELGIEFDMVLGTSVGALNGAIIAQGDFEKAMAIWSNLETKMVFDVDVTLPDLSKKSQLAAMKGFFKEFVSKGGASCEGLRGLLQQYVAEEDVRKSKVDYGLVTLKLTDLKPIEIFKKDIEDGKMLDYMVASSSCFPAVKAYEIDGQVFVDGGYVDNIPVDMALSSGVTDIIVVDLECIGVVKKAEIPKEITVRTIRCRWDLGNFLLFEKELIKRNIDLGYYDTMKAYGVYDGYYYAFVKSDIREILCRISDRLLEFHSKIGITIIDKLPNVVDETLRKTLVKFISKHTNGAELSIKNILLTCMECSGLIFSIPPTTSYNIKEFRTALATRLDEYLIEYTKSLHDQGICEDKVKLLDIPAMLKLLNSRSVTIILSQVIKRLHNGEERPKNNLLTVAALMPKEFFSAMYLALNNELTLED